MQRVPLHFRTVATKQWISGECPHGLAFDLNTFPAMDTWAPGCRQRTVGSRQMDGFKTSEPEFATSWPGRGALVANLPPEMQLLPWEGLGTSGKPFTCPSFLGDHSAENEEQ